MARSFRTRIIRASIALSALLITSPAALAADPDLDSAITMGFGKLIKYGRWGAALVLAIIFCLAWAERGQNPDNPHEVNKGTRKMIWAGAGFVAVIGYRLILTGLVQWFGIDPATIPTFLWQ